jgi:predicted RNA-binding Zn ribbon-like protein
MDSAIEDESTDVVAFLNTLDLDAGRDDLTDVAAFSSWLAGTVDVGRMDVAASSLLRARRLRDALRRSARANHDGEVDHAALAELDVLSRELELRPRFGPEGVVIDSDADGGDGVLGRFLARAAAAMRDGSWARVKLCADDACAWAFVDASRNRSGRWCSMAGCGNRAKARAYRSRGSEDREI